MKIVDIKSYVLSAPIKEPFGTWGKKNVKRDSMIVEVITDEGIIGWGESVCHGSQRGETASAFIEFVFKPLLLGRNPFDVEVLWEEMYHTSRPYGGGAAVNAMSGIDVALWDVIGRTLNQPIHMLIGGAFRKEVRPYATGFYRIEGKSYPDEYVTEAKRHVANGFKAFKLKTGFGVKEDLEYIYAVRDAVGPDVIIAMDANCAYDASTARRILLESQDAHIHFFEEPIKADDIEGYKMLRNLTTTFLAAGENSFSKYDFKHLIVNGAVDILQPDVCSAGGITECKKIAAMAQAYSTMLVPHVWGTGIGLAAALQFIASIPVSSLSFNGDQQPLLEYDQSEHPFRESLINHAIRMVDGKLSVPTEPGLGVNVNRDVIEEYKLRLFV